MSGQWANFVSSRPAASTASLRRHEWFPLYIERSRPHLLSHSLTISSFLSPPPLTIRIRARRQVRHTTTSKNNVNLIMQPFLNGGEEERHHPNNPERGHRSTMQTILTVGKWKSVFTVSASELRGSLAVCPHVGHGRIFVSDIFPLD